MKNNAIQKIDALTLLLGITADLLVLSANYLGGFQNKQPMRFITKSTNFHTLTLTDLVVK